MKLLKNFGRLPQGFLATGIIAGIKKSKKPDLGLLFSPLPCVASGMVTSNRVKAAPLVACAAALKQGRLQAVIVNSGNANCMTGAQGIRDAKATASELADKLGLSVGEVLVSSTGIIGRPLPLEKIKQGIPGLIRSMTSRGFSGMAQAIMTTDTFPKEVSGAFRLSGRPVVISGIAKGAGMIAPNLKSATMLAFLATDAALTKSVLDQALASAVARSFNAITIDACMSTNDIVVVLANGAAGNALIRPGTKDAAVFTEALGTVCEELARQIVCDGEGATKFIAITVQGAKTYPEAQRLAFAVANSNLFKCAMFGCDPNWGRIAAALGSVSSGLDWERLDITLNKKPVFRAGKPIAVKDNRFLKVRDIDVLIDLHQGTAVKRVYTTDLSYGYVRINADYN